MRGEVVSTFRWRPGGVPGRSLGPWRRPRRRARIRTRPVQQGQRRGPAAELAVDQHLAVLVPPEELREGSDLGPGQRLGADRDVQIFQPALADRVPLGGRVDRLVGLARCAEVDHGGEAVRFRAGRSSAGVGPRSRGSGGLAWCPSVAILRRARPPAAPGRAVGAGHSRSSVTERPWDRQATNAIPALPTPVPRSLPNR